MATEIKKSAIPPSGYFYQTLVGLRLLCDWLDTPTVYNWVRFEADPDDAPKSLDDVVYQRADGLKGLLQVKFTVDPFEPNNALSWKWLMSRKGERSTSLLQKWSAAVDKEGVANCAELCLITNRRPDAEFSGHLRESKVVLSLLSESLREQVLENFTDVAQAERFFASFDFRHSYQDYEGLERNVSQAFESRHTDHYGWLCLLRKAWDWSLVRNAPPPDGRITLEILRRTISERQPRPLDQAFHIPAGYVPPDNDFADQFLQEAETGSWDLRVLWGAPGQGKSTFVSYLCEKLRERHLPYVRHHYFLNLQDPSDRFSFRNAALSLIAQMRAELQDDDSFDVSSPEDLRACVVACAEAWGHKGKRFFLLIDGLDHVWRENHQDVAPVDALFAQLLPPPANTTLILGTQRIDERQLSTRLSRYLQSEHWVELPRMRLTAVRAWLSAQHEGGLFRLAGEQSQELELGELASAFERVCDGHPLVLTYTFLALSNKSAVLTPSTVDDGAPVPHGDARAYYKSLWQQLPWPAKDALHLMAQDDFIWSAEALEQCLQARDFHLEEEIGHLLASVDAGLIAFHGSLYLFVVAQPDHAKRVAALVPTVTSWLQGEDAPGYLRWAWLWLYQARGGEYAAMLTGTTKQWALDALQRAYPLHQLLRILTSAEDAAFEQEDYERALEKRALKKRLAQGLTYQLDDAQELQDIALQLTNDAYPAMLLASETSQSSIEGLHQLAMLYLTLGHTERAIETQHRMRAKINDRIQTGALRKQEYRDYVERILQVTAGTRSYESTRIAQMLRRQPNKASLFSDFLTRASRGTDPTPLLAFAAVPLQASLRRVLEVETIRTCGWCDARLHEWPEFKYFRKHPLSVCWRFIYQRGGAQDARVPELKPPRAFADRFVSDDGGELAEYLHFTFFGTVARTMQLHGAHDPNRSRLRVERTWLDSALQRLAAVAHSCGAILARGEVPSFSMVYSALGLSPPGSNDHESWQDHRAVNDALVLIASDLFLLCRSRSGLRAIPQKEWERSRASPFFSNDRFLTTYLKRGYRLLDERLVRSHLEHERIEVLSRVERFNEKAEALTFYCRWAMAYGLEDLATSLLADVYRCAIGYGWRKDWRLPTVLESVTEVARHDRVAGAWALEALAPIYCHIHDMAEQTGARTSDLSELIVELVPHQFPAFYRELLRNAQWDEAETAFAVFAKRVDLESSAARAALSFLWEPGVRNAIEMRRDERPEVVDALVAPWIENKVSTGSSLQPRTKEKGLTEEEGRREDASLMPPLEEYPPEKFDEFLGAVDAAQSGFDSFGHWVTSWFTYWLEQGRPVQVLTALSRALEYERRTDNLSHLLDRAYQVSLKLQGPRKAFDWLVLAHLHRRGWDGYYHGQAESAQRLAIVASNHAKDWRRFVALTSPMVQSRYAREGERSIPDAPLISLLLQVGEHKRAASMMRTMVALVVEEFEVQPLPRPSWLEVSP